jgi:hypothetical protein
MDLLCDFGQVESHFNPFGDSRVLLQGTCTVCAKRTIGSKIILDAPMVLLGDEAHMHAGFGLFGHRANLDTR